MKAQDRLVKIIDSVDIYTTEGMGYQYLVDKTKKEIAQAILKEFIHIDELPKPKIQFLSKDRLEYQMAYCDGRLSVLNEIKKLRR